MKCEDCGSDDGYRTTCPFDADVHNKEVPVVLCDKCIQLRAWEI